MTVRNVRISIVIDTNGSRREIKWAEKLERKFMEAWSMEILKIASDDVREQLKE